MGAFVDLTGQRFGRLIVLRRGDNVGKAPGWNCRCDCGRSCRVRGDLLRNRKTVSCGCYQRDKVTTHGMSLQPGWHSWAAMRRRCHDPRDKQFPQYGGRGILVCERWRNDFAAFMADMGPRPPGYSVERIDNERGYEPSNCKWATAAEQQRNKRDNHVITFAGKTATLTDWARSLQMDRTTLSRRILAMGWPVEKALTQPVRPMRAWR